MNLEDQLRESLQARGKECIPPLDLRGRVIGNLATAKGRFKKRIVVSVMVAMLIIPTGAFAYKALSADVFYGSFENIRKNIASVTMEGYLQLSAKLDQAQGELGKEEYAQFVELLKIVTSAKIEYADVYGNIDYDQVSPEKVAEIKEGLMAVQPYFDKLNNQPSSKEVLTTIQYEQYIDALMTYEKIVVQSKLNPSEGPIEVEMVLPHLQEEFLEVQSFISYVDERQREAVLLNDR